MALFPVRPGRLLSPRILTQSKVLAYRPPLLCGLSNLTKSKSVEENIKLCRSDSPLTYESPQGSGKPLVLMLGWLLARTKHLTKYTNIYASKGFDVLQIRVTPFQVLWPVRAQSFIEKIFKVLEQEDCQGKPILIHGFSVGAYLYGEMLVKMYREPEKHADLCHRIMGQVFDSPVDKDQVAYGMSQNLVKNPLLQPVVFQALQQYLNVFRSSVSDHFQQAQNAFLQNALSLPTLLFFSHIDPIANPQVIESTIRWWTSRGIYVLHKSWNDTKHVSHLQKHPEEYVKYVLNFIARLPLVPCTTDIAGGALESSKDDEIAKAHLTDQKQRSSGSLP